MRLQIVVRSLITRNIFLSLQNSCTLRQEIQIEVPDDSLMIVNLRTQIATGLWAILTATDPNAELSSDCGSRMQLWHTSDICTEINLRLRWRKTSYLKRNNRSDSESPFLAWNPIALNVTEISAGVNTELLGVKVKLENENYKFTICSADLTLRHFYTDAHLVDHMSSLLVNWLTDNTNCTL